MIDLEDTRFDIGETVWVLCRHRDWGTPSLSLTTVTRIIWDENGEVKYLVPESGERDEIIKVFKFDDELEAKAEFCSAVERHQTRKPELD